MSSSVAPGIKPPGPLMLDSDQVADNWKLFKQKWELYVTLSDLNSKPREYQVALLLHSIGDTALKVYNGFAFTTPEDSRTVAEILDLFNKFAVGSVNQTYERYKFNCRAQGEGESFETFLSSVRFLAKTCGYCDTCLPSILRDRLLLGVRDETVRIALLKEQDLDLEKCINICQASENASLHGRALNTTTTSAVNKVTSSRQTKSSKPKAAKPKAVKHASRPARECKFCARSHPMKKELCPAWGKTCKNCKKLNHFALKCTEQEVHHVDTSHSESEDPAWINSTKDGDKGAIMVKIHINDQVVAFEADSGASMSVLPSKHLPANTVLQPTMKTLKMWNGVPHKPLGLACVTIRNPKNNREYPVNFLIVKENLTPLLSKSVSTHMGILSINEENFTRAHKVSVDQYDDVFSDTLGSLPGHATLKLKDGAVPTAMPDRRTPISIRDKLKVELDRLVSSGVLTPVDEPTPWTSQLVIVHKKNGALRVCVDPRELNKALVRERFTIPILEDQLHELGASRLFTKVDLTQGYWHVQLDEASSILTTFQTCFGRYRWLRLPFGLSVSAEIFQRKLLQSIEGLPGVLCIADDIVVHGPDEATHDDNLQRFLQRCREVGIKLNKSKLELRKTEIVFMGHKVTQKGLCTDPGKVEAISKMKAPENTTELRRFLGTVNYLGKFIPKLATVIHPLTNLLRDDVKWQWTSAQQTAFDQVKEQVTSAPVLAFYDPTKELTLENDASEYGLGSALLQDGKPIAFASRSLNDTERRYAQIEKEMLAVAFGLSRHHHYTYARDVRVITDHKPLVSIVQKPLSCAPKRLQNLLLKTQYYNFTLEYRSGTSIPVADALSRAPLPDKPQHESVHSVFYTPLSKDLSFNLRMR